MPMQLREVLEDLRLGRTVLRTEDPGLPEAADRLGRRVFSGLLVLALVGGGVCSCTTCGTSSFGTALLAVAALVWLVHVGRDLRRGWQNAALTPNERAASPPSPGRALQPLARPWRKKAMTKARRTSDSMSARPRIIGVWMRAEAPGLREMPSSAAAAALP